MLGFSGETARIVKSQNWIALPSFRDLASWKSRRTQHICRMTGELGHWHNRFFSMSMIASSTWLCVWLCKILRMLSERRHSIVESGWSQFFSKMKDR